MPVNKNMFQDAPWMIAAANYDKYTGKTRLSAVFAEPDDIDTSKVFDIEDYAHCDVTAGFESDKSIDQLLDAAWAAGLFAVQLMGADNIKIWTYMSPDAGRACEADRHNNTTVKITPVDKPGDAMANKLNYLRLNLFIHVRSS